MPSPLILNVDDNHINRYLRSQVLQSAGFRVLEARTGAETLEISFRDRPGLVLLDVHLPDASGIELCWKIKSDPRTQSTMVLQISASAVEIADAVRGLEGGADGYLIEPVEPELLIAHVRSLLRLRQSEIALQDSDQRLRLALNAARMATWNWEIATDQVTLGGACGQLFGNAANDFRGSFATFLRMLHPVDVGNFERQVKATLDSPAGECLTEFRVSSALASHWLEFSGQVLFDDAGRPSRFLGVMTDVTEHKRAQAALQEANTDLKYFAFAASHDLQAPIRTVRVFAELLCADPKMADQPEARAHLERIVAAATRMQSLVTNLLAYSQAGKEPETARTMVPLDQALERALSSLQGPLLEAGGEVHWDKLPVVEAWSDDITQVLQNLISNAIKYRRAGAPPRIRIQAARSSHHWTISVSDNGRGFKPEYAERIFDAFARLQGVEVSGTGLGLAICRRIIERHGGRIWAESIPGEGATFHFELPADAVAASGS